MGLAPFFDRARQSVAQVLRDVHPDAFEQRLAETVVTLAFDSQAASTAEGLASLDMAARLIARLYPRVRVLMLDGDDVLADELIALMRHINPNLQIVTEIGTDLHVAVVAGKTNLETDATVYMGSDRWIARVSTVAPVGSGGSPNPFGAGAAACIAMANVFRAVFESWIVKPELDVDVTFSLLNFELGTTGANDDLRAGLDLGLVQLAGVGAIGNAFIWAMSRLRGVKGEIHLIDHEAVDLTNLQRYLLTTMTDIDASKVALAASALKDSGIEARAFPMSWAGYVEQAGHHRFDRVAVALDSVRDRIQVQGSLPRRVYNAWTQAGDLGISRHGFDGNEACLACLYLPTGKRRNEDEIVAEELGFRTQEQILRVRTMLYLGSPVGEPFVREIAANVGADVEALLPFANLPLRAFRQKAICGNAILRAADGAGPELEVPMAFQSALAGVMLAAEIVASTPDVRAAQPATRSVVDLTRALPGRITFPMLKRAQGPVRCICQDPDYIGVYRAKYGAEAV
ncbi:E2 ligase fold family C protein [Bradyrhizobium sp. CIAT3101]|uniref:E2 ligase fold family C protein n=1 Tax=Bradyrhizobium sp. CIAT3101 TaxID=439387 RepID=UPI0024B11D7C|nr:E2 ligase fold family C protein [Bradyrhizobium sp. CIAT3101]WFU80766.1 E2 ligase fold family C protein [Bradyrhizobium sp. CIAT3101]